jgi:hypothetical protein
LAIVASCGEAGAVVRRGSERGVREEQRVEEGHRVQRLAGENDWKAEYDRVKEHEHVKRDESKECSQQERGLVHE